MRLLVTENQYKMIKKTLNEEVSEKYEREVEVSFNYSGVKLNGMDIDSIYAPNINISYNIDIEGRSWGIKNISLYNVRGPEEMLVTVNSNSTENDYDNLTETEINIKIDWENIDYNEESGQGVITVGDEIEVHLKNDENGNIVFDGVSVPTYTL